jgi:S-adenosylhomocysteine hydrolase
MISGKTVIILGFDYALLKTISTLKHGFGCEVIVLDALPEF